VLPTPRAELVRDRCFEAGLLVNAARPNVIRLMPALDIAAPELEAAESMLSAALGH
jgi:4-aminobutyrate aminotransferase-like enzyme